MTTSNAEPTQGRVIFSDEDWFERLAGAVQVASFGSDKNKKARHPSPENTALLSGCPKDEPQSNYLSKCQINYARKWLKNP